MAKSNFKIEKAGTIPSHVTVIARRDEFNIQDDYLLIELDEPWSQECYDVLRKHGFELPYIQEHIHRFNKKYEESDETVTREQADKMIRIINAAVEGQALQCQYFSNDVYTDCKIRPRLQTKMSLQSRDEWEAFCDIDKIRLKEISYTNEELFKAMTDRKEFIHTETNMTGKIISIDMNSIITIEYKDKENSQKAFTFTPETFMKEHTITDRKPIKHVL